MFVHGRSGSPIRDYPSIHSTRPLSLRLQAARAESGLGPRRLKAQGEWAGGMDRGIVSYRAPRPAVDCAFRRRGPRPDTARRCCHPAARSRRARSADCPCTAPASSSGVAASPGRIRSRPSPPEGAGRVGGWNGSRIVPARPDRTETLGAQTRRNGIRVTSSGEGGVQAAERARRLRAAGWQHRRAVSGLGPRRLKAQGEWAGRKPSVLKPAATVFASLPLGKAAFRRAVNSGDAASPISGREAASPEFTARLNAAFPRGSDANTVAAGLSSPCAFRRRGPRPDTARRCCHPAARSRRARSADCLRARGRIARVHRPPERRLPQRK
jgi:hypothetical protein